jgi:hypothetical protein
MTSDLLPVSHEEKIREVEREIKKRQFVFPRMVRSKKMTQYEADRRIEVMEQIAMDLYKAGRKGE